MSKKVSRNAELLLYTLMRVGRRRPALLEARGGYDEHESSDEDKRQAPRGHFADCVQACTDLCGPAPLPNCLAP